MNSERGKRHVSWCVIISFHLIAQERNNNNNTLFTHATSRSNKNSLKHVRETKSIENKEIV